MGNWTIVTSESIYILCPSKCRKRAEIKSCETPSIEIISNQVFSKYLGQNITALHKNVILMVSSYSSKILSLRLSYRQHKTYTQIWRAFTLFGPKFTIASACDICFLQLIPELYTNWCKPLISRHHSSIARETLVMALLG